jgi:hypothetical protein
MTVDDRAVPLPAPLGDRVTVPRFLSGGLLLAATAAVLVVLGWSAAFVGDQIRLDAIALAVFCLSLLLLMSAMADYDGLGLATWRIGPWSLLWGAFAFGLATISWLGAQTGTAGEILPGSILRALWMIAVAMAVLTAGYCAGPYRFAGAQAARVAGALGRRFTEEVRGPIVPWALFLVGIVAQIGYAALTGYFGYVGAAAAAATSASGYAQYIALAGECVPLAVAVAAIRAYRTRTMGARLTLVVLFTAAVISGAAAGAKTNFVVAILAVIIPRTMIRRRLPAGLIVAAIAFFLLIVIPFNLSYRASARGAVTLSTGQAVATAPAIAGQVLKSDLSLATLQQSVDYLAVRIRTIDSPAIIMQRTPSQIPYQNPALLLISPVVDVIPRAVWPGKPVLNPGWQMSQEYYQLPPQIYTSSDVTPEGDLFRHGGWFWLIAGMFIGGCAIRILDETTDLRRSVHGAFLILLLFPDIVEAGSDCATLLAGIPGIILLWLAVVALSFKRRPAEASTASPAAPS